MMHTDQNPDCFPGQPKTGIMRAALNGNQNPQGLSDQDKCQFMKLYCPTLTSVEWEDVREARDNAPGLLLQLSGNTGTIIGVDCEIASVQAYDIEGRDLGNVRFDSNPVGKRLTLDFGSIADGAIILTFTCSDRREIVRRLFMIQRGY